MAGNSHFLLKTHHKNPCNDVCVFFSLQPRLQCVTSQLRAVFVQQNTKKLKTRVTRQGMGLSVSSARDLGCVPCLVGHFPRVITQGLGSPIQARRRQRPHLTQSFIGDRTKNTMRVLRTAGRGSVITQSSFTTLPPN